MNSAQLYSSCYLVRSHASGANIYRSDCTFIIDLYLFYVGLPHSVGPSGHLAAGNTNPMTGAYAFVTDLTFCHISHLLGF